MGRLQNVSDVQRVLLKHRLCWWYVASVVDIVCVKFWG